MKRTLSLLAVGALTLSAFARDANSDFRAFILKVLPQVEHAFDTKNAGFFRTIAAPNFVDVEGGKETPGPQAIKEMEAQFRMVESVSCHFKLLSSSVRGNTGIAMTTGHVTMVMKPQGKGGKPQKMSMDINEKETWVKLGGAWKIQRLEQLGPPKMKMG